MLHAILTCLALMAFTGEAFAVTVSWTCNNAFNHRDTGCGW